MSHDIINSWVEKAKSADVAMPAVEGVQVIRRANQSRGSMIMEIAERIRPWLTEMFQSVRDENGMLVQPARVRGIALNVAQGIVKEQEQKAGV
jgi:hypothetical protein